jgi:hypothetical protein
MSRPEHTFTPMDVDSFGNPICVECGLRESSHVRRIRPRKEYHAAREKLRDRPKRIDRIIGIDGEGVGRSPHRYTFIAASDESGQRWQSGNSVRLSTVECLDFILSLPERSLVFGFAFQYDLTKILTDLPNDPLYLLYHEKFRARITDSGRIIYRPIHWNGYKLNYINRRFTVSRDKRSTTVWDIFRFFQSKFTTALYDWKIGNKDELDRMARMKDLRSEFDKLSESEVQAYCLNECQSLAKLGRSLLDAHVNAGLELKNYFGAGSTASALLTKIGIRGKRGETPEAMCEPLASAFFGGRFENSVIGPVTGPVYSYDISSAYPYQATFLPCLEHGKWEFHDVNRTRNLRALVQQSTLALIKWRSQPDLNRAWGGLPVRSSDGTIAFPLAGKGGWCWKDEYYAAQRLNSETFAVCAWIYNTDCDCKPFAALPQIYRERVKLGKDGPGIVLKLGSNSVYGKLAQSTGINPPFQNWVWAGNITSGCRAMLLDCIASASNRWDVLMLATDSVASRVPLRLAPPKESGTSDLGKPLGGWEPKLYPNGIFAVRPGIWFPLNPTEDQIKDVRARGLGRRVLYDHWRQIVEAFEKGEQKVTIGCTCGNPCICGRYRGPTRFVGVKSALTKSAAGIKRGPDYGEWIPWEIELGFQPQPKRRSVLPDRRLECFPYLDWESVPYSRAMRSPEALLLELAQQIAEEQPDADLTDIGVDAQT